MALTVESAEAIEGGLASEERYPFVVLYDGVCGLCSRTVQFVLQRDRAGKFRFAPLQGEYAARLLSRHGLDPTELNTVYLVQDAGGDDETLFVRARAIFRILRELGGVWRMVSWLGALPAGLLDAGYRFIARRRYRWFGQYESCPLPTAEQRARFLGP